MHILCHLFLIVLSISFLLHLADAGDKCGNYMFMNYITKNKPTAFCDSPKSFGANGDTGHGYAALYVGCHWGSCSADKTLPALVSSIGNMETFFTQKPSVGAQGYDSTYDIWFDELKNPNGRNAHFELMVWLQWTSDTSPIAGSYDASGKAVPSKRGIKIGNYTWDLYYRKNGGAGDNGPSASFLLQKQLPGVRFKMVDFSNWLITNGYLKKGWYLTSIQAGWEYHGKGTFKGTAFGVTAARTAVTSTGDDTPINVDDTPYYPEPSVRDTHNSSTEMFFIIGVAVLVVSVGLLAAYMLYRRRMRKLQHSFDMQTSVLEKVSTAATQVPAPPAAQQRLARPSGSGALMLTTCPR